MTAVASDRTVYLTGKTYDFRQKLAKAGFAWNGQLKAWTLTTDWADEDDVRVYLHTTAHMASTHSITVSFDAPSCAE